MVKCVNKSIVLFSVFLLLLMIVPSAFASDAVDNQTVISSDEQIEISAVDDGGVIYSHGEDTNILTGSNDIYFNASAESDGRGTQSSPYKYLQYNRLTSGCTAHFADGTYELDSKKGIYSSMTFMGQSAQNTIIKFNGIAFNVGDGYTLTLKDLTLDHATVKNLGTVSATNVIFKNGVAVDDTSYGYDNAYGGAIYNYVSTDYYGYVTNVPKNTLYNCTFLNNSAMYGGAIYLPYGELSLSNCKFINNSAHWFGGAITSDKDSKISVVGTVFENCRSVDDAGGAIYAFSTDLEVRDSTFNNCSANFAGAICSLNSEILISYSNFTNNLARYEGGAVYKMYGSGTVIKSNFTKNAALNGGALFSDNCTSFEIKNSEFASNAATGFGGAIFSNANPKLTVDGVTFTDNKASYNANMLNQSNFSPIVSSTNNYSLFVYKSLFNGTLPARYNLAENGFVTDVKNQQDSGNCWAFAALASLETCVLKASNKTFNFSVENMKNLIEMYEKSRSEGFGDEVKRRIMLGTFVLSSGYYDEYYKKAKMIQGKITEEISRASEDCDIIAAPSSPTVAFKIGEKMDSPLEMYKSDVCTVTANIAGLPAISIPCGRNKMGLPIGIQLMGKRFDDSTVLDSAYGYEEICWK